MHVIFLESEREDIDVSFVTYSLYDRLESLDDLRSKCFSPILRDPYKMSGKVICSMRRVVIVEGIF